MCGLKGVPQRERIAHKSISNIKRLRHVESRETPLCALGIGGLIIAVQACSDVFGIADAMEKSSSTIRRATIWVLPTICRALFCASNSC